MSSSIRSLSSSEQSIISEALSSSRRRITLRVLKEADTSLTLAGLAREVVQSERERSQQAVDADRTDQVRISLHHCHLPKLAAADLVEYDRDDRTVAMPDSTPLDDIEDALE